MSFIDKTLTETRILVKESVKLLHRITQVVMTRRNEPRCSKTKIDLIGKLVKFQRIVKIRW